RACAHPEHVRVRVREEDLRRRELRDSHTEEAELGAEEAGDIDERVVAGEDPLAQAEGARGPCAVRRFSKRARELRVGRDGFRLRVETVETPEALRPLADLGSAAVEIAPRERARRKQEAARERNDLLLGAAARHEPLEEPGPRGRATEIEIADRPRALFDAPLTNPGERDDLRKELPVGLELVGFDERDPVSEKRAGGRLDDVRPRGDLAEREDVLSNIDARRALDLREERVDRIAHLGKLLDDAPIHLLEKRAHGEARCRDAVGALGNASEKRIGALETARAREERLEESAHSFARPKKAADLGH